MTMRNLLLLCAVLLCLALGANGCETPEDTLNEATQDLQKGITGQGQLEERGWEEVDVYQN